jgi:hypothetical protein
MTKEIRMTKPGRLWVLVGLREMIQGLDCLALLRVVLRTQLRSEDGNFSDILTFSHLLPHFWKNF